MTWFQWLQIPINIGFVGYAFLTWRWKVNAQKTMMRHQIVLSVLLEVAPELREKIDQRLDAWLKQ